jgi:hypothetical protein
MHSSAEFIHLLFMWIAIFRNMYPFRNYKVLYTSLYASSCLSIRNTQCRVLKVINRTLINILNSDRYSVVGYLTTHVRWVPCHHRMARPQVADVRRVPSQHRMARPQVADVSRVPSQHRMARPQVADGGDGLQIWRVAADILNKQSRTASKGWSCTLGVRREANNSSL